MRVPICLRLHSSNNMGGYGSPLFISSLISSFYFIPNCSPLACYCCCLLHPLTSCLRRLFICHCLQHFFSTPLSSLLRSLRQSLECQGFFLHLLSLSAFLLKYQESPFLLDSKHVRVRECPFCLKLLVSSEQPAAFM